MQALYCLSAALTVTLAGTTGGEVRIATDTVDFNREVRPLFAEHCLDCHGNDGRARESDLRLDLPEEFLKDLGGYQAVVPGNSAESELYLRLTDADEPMPPLDEDGHGTRLTNAEIEKIKRWIDEGAKWSPHWSFVTPRRPAVPEITDGDWTHWARNPIDNFILARLGEAGLKPSPEASRETLIRRVTLDLTGLPPSLAEVDAFLADKSPRAYAKLVERLLASPSYGEHMAVDWLDAARYADTHGLHLDNARSIWPYRDWVISALNANLSFDRFTSEQLAGDLMPEATQEQRIASGFNRCNPTTAEGGLIAAEYLAKYASDRASTTATVWLGLSAACARCHDHRYDPLTQRDFYGLYAFFNNLAEEASDGNGPTPPPNLTIFDEAAREKLGTLLGREGELREAMASPLPTVDTAQHTWESAWEKQLQSRWTHLQPLKASADDGVELTIDNDSSLLPVGANPERVTYTVEAETELENITGVRLELIPDESFFNGGVGRADNGNFVLTEVELEVAQTVGGEFAPVELVSARADYSQRDYNITAAIDGNPGTGWAVDKKPERRFAAFAPASPIGQAGGTHLRLRLSHDSQFPRHALGRFRLSVSTDSTLTPVSAGVWSTRGPLTFESAQAAFAADPGVSAPPGINDEWTPHPEYEDGSIHSFEGELSAIYLRRSLISPEARTISVGLGSDDAIQVWLNNTLLLANDARRGAAADQEQLELDLNAGANELLVKVVNDRGAFAFTYRVVEEHLGALPLTITGSLLLDSSERTTEQRNALREHYRREYSPEWSAMEEQLLALIQERETLKAEATTTIVSADDPQRRQAYYLERGEYDAPGDAVDPATPAFLPGLSRESETTPANRLDLARWLCDPANPLPARVTVNRFWQHHFGRGLVATPGDFGSRGALPSHPLLLDWLGTEFVESGWDMKHMRHLMVTSACYRQSAAIPKRSAELDPTNALLSHAPRLRLSGEVLRDSALAVSGLLVEKLGGPGVRPYQPPGIWEAVAYTSSNTAKYTRGSGEDLYRRSIYTFWKRTAPPPMLQIFDAPSREVCSVGRTTTATPMQALALMNDVQFIEAARFLAQRMLVSGGQTVESQASYGFHAVTSRMPTADELQELVDVFMDQRREFLANPELAELLLSNGEAASDEELGKISLAAWTVVANLILNLDEAANRG